MNNSDCKSLMCVCISGSASKYLYNILVFAESDTPYNFRKDKTASSIMKSVNEHCLLIHI